MGNLLDFYISTHAPLAGRDGCKYVVGRYTIRFQPTRPLRGATCSTRERKRQDAISTHAPLAGRDRLRPVYCGDGGDFNPRAPCGARPTLPACRCPPCNFNPRAPCGARRSLRLTAATENYFNPRAPCGARRRYSERRAVRNDISTHAPLAGRDHETVHCVTFASGFQPTRPLRGAT